jgi:2-C-methyl-D-erythritol 4-phosphate cytidylyltransferase/2-C-methyl-D-erythritol 2,4-cyclodiphosphate synthase
VPAAGRGSRFASAQAVGPKQYAALKGATVIEWSLAALLAEPRIAGIVVVLAADDTRWPGTSVAAAVAGTAAPKLRTAVGGADRQDSVLSGLNALKAEAAADDWVLVHDAARPCLSTADLTALLDAVEAPREEPRSGFVLAAPVVDTVKRERGGIVVETVDRSGLWRALTPQVFGFLALQQALEEVVRLGVAVTDEAQAMERRRLPAQLVRGSPFNIKVTRPEDLAMAEAILKGTEVNRMRIGQGFDVHAFGAGDHVVLGGVRIEYSHGVVAHSDGDVVIHALCDALLGALGLGDIGQHFPDTDPRFRGADSRVFLREVAAKMRAAGLTLVNADITVLAEAPRIGKYRAVMARTLAADLACAVEAVNIKATTTEKLGFVGRGEGLAANAAVLLDSRSP